MAHIFNPTFTPEAVSVFQSIFGENLGVMMAVIVKILFMVIVPALFIFLLLSFSFFAAFVLPDWIKEGKIKELREKIKEKRA